MVGIPGSLLENSIHRDADPQLWKACYTAQELAQAIAYYSCLNADQKTALQQTAMAFRAVQFKPVTRKLVYEFLGDEMIYYFKTGEIVTKGSAGEGFMSFGDTGESSKKKEKSNKKPNTGGMINQAGDAFKGATGGSQR